jgi:hypothetical protein
MSAGLGREAIPQDPELLKKPISVSQSLAGQGNGTSNTQGT